MILYTAKKKKKKKEKVIKNKCILNYSYEIALPYFKTRITYYIYNISQMDGRSTQ